MARLNIYVSDELKARMDEVGDDVNWSEVVRPAIHAAVANHEHRRSPSMNSAIERLRASKQEAVQEDTADGKRDGREWAEATAEYKELSRISKIDDSTLDNLWRAVDPNLDESEFFKYVFGDIDEEPSEEYVEGFIEGAKEFFSEVRNKL
jgi:hypothetical protein